MSEGMGVNRKQLHDAREEAKLQRIERAEKYGSEVTVMQVSMANMVDVADWCRGAVRVEDCDGEVKVYVQVDTTKTPWDTKARAYVGYFITRNDGSFKVYTYTEYQNTFSMSLQDRGRFQKVLRIVKTAMAEQDLETHRAQSSTMPGEGRDMALLAEEMAWNIMEVF